MMTTEAHRRYGMTGIDYRRRRRIGTEIEAETEGRQCTMAVVEVMVGKEMAMCGGGVGVLFRLIGIEIEIGIGEEMIETAEGLEVAVEVTVDS